MRLARTRIALTALVTSALVACSAPTLDAGAHYGIYELDGGLAIQDSSMGLSSSNSMSDLGLDEEDDAIGAFARFKFGGPMLYVSAIQPEFSGTGTLTSELDDGSGTIPVGATVDSRLSLDVYTGMFFWDLFPTSAAELGLGIGVSAIDYDASFTDTGTSTQIASDEALPIPVVGAMASTNIGPFEASGYLAYMSIDVDGDQVSYTDLDVRGTYNLFGGDDRFAGHLLLGYKLTDFDLEYQDGTEFVDAQLEISGPYLGLRFSF